MKTKVKLSKQKKIDKNIGDLINKGIIIKKSFGNNKIPKNPKKILFIKFEAVGDSLLCLPAIKEVKKKTKAKIYVICSKANLLVFENQDFIDEIILLDHRKFEGKRMYNLINKLKKEKIDVVVDTGQSANLSGIMSHLIGKSSIGFKKLKKATRNKVYTQSVKLDFNKHMVNCYFDLVKPLGVKKPKEVILEKIKISEDVKKKVNKLISNKKNLVAIHACNELEYKVWPKEKFAKIIEYLIKEKKKNIILLGSINEKKDNNLLIKNLDKSIQKKIVNLSGETGMRDLVGIMKHVDLFIGNDGGPMHIAASEGIKTIGLFGFETPVRYGPWGKKCESVFKGTKCGPCIKAYNDEWPNCFNPICIQSITIEEVKKSIHKLKI
jgi:lipopolysaccharide heptosyltransferase II